MAIWEHLNERVDYGMLVKIFREGRRGRSAEVFAGQDNREQETVDFRRPRRIENLHVAQRANEWLDPLFLKTDGSVDLLLL